MENTEIPSLGKQLLLLKTEHRRLDEEIERMQEFPYNDQLLLRRLKKQKLMLKQNIERVKALLIPDLDA